MFQGIAVAPVVAGRWGPRVRLPGGGAGATPADAEGALISVGRRHAGGIIGIIEIIIIIIIVMITIEIIRMNEVFSSAIHTFDF